MYEVVYAQMLTYPCAFFRLIQKKEPPKRKAVKQRKEKSIERALLNMDKQQEKLQKDEVKAERISSLKNLY